MGNEIRKVPPSWNHPKQSDGKYVPLFDQPYQEALDEWLENFELWKQDQHFSQISKKRYTEFAGDAPRYGKHRPEWTEEPTHYQVYENVSEGTPISPKFATLQELAIHLYVHGDDWGRLWDIDPIRRLFRYSGFSDQLVPEASAIAPKSGLSSQ
jgi:hypothetical protein